MSIDVSLLLLDEIVPAARAKGHREVGADADIVVIGTGRMAGQG